MTDWDLAAIATLREELDASAKAAAWTNDTELLARIAELVDLVSRNEKYKDRPKIRRPWDPPPATKAERHSARLKRVRGMLSSMGKGVK